MKSLVNSGEFEGIYCFCVAACRFLQYCHSYTDMHDRLSEINSSLFCEECHHRALDFLEAATSAVTLAGSEAVTTLQARVEVTLHSFLSLHKACPSCKEG